MGNGLHALTVDPARRGGKQDRGLGLRGLPLERLTARQDNMDAGVAHAADAADSTGQLPFHGAQLVHPLLELARDHADIAIDDFIADNATRWQRIARQEQAGP